MNKLVSPKWEVGVTKIKEYEGDFLVVGVDNGDEPCTVIAVISPADKISKEDKTRAHLIAAAPDLLNALVELVSRTEFICDNSYGPETDNAYTKAREAITKATGEKL